MASDAKDSSKNAPATGQSASFRGPTPGVKDAQLRTWRQRGRALFDGWPFIPLTAGSAAFVALLIFPRAIGPLDLPLPKVDRVREQAHLREVSLLAAQVARASLPFDVRVVGETLRQHGAAEARADRNASVYLDELGRVTRTALHRHGAEPILALLAYQVQAFQDAVKGWQTTGLRGSDLIELGGAFFERAGTNGWLDAKGRMLATPAELDVLFRARWLHATGFEAHPAFKLTLNDWRLYYGFLLRYPPKTGGPAAAQRLRFVEALERKDPLYPALLARGILELELGNYPSASRVLKAHLLAHPQGEWHLRARNLLLTSLELEGQ